MPVGEWPGNRLVIGRGGEGVLPGIKRFSWVSLSQVGVTGETWGVP